MSKGQPTFDRHALIDPTPMPEHIPKVTEVGASSAPLMSAAFFIGARCKPYNDDFMKCKVDANGRGELDCLREGRKVTRCASSVIQDINTHCLEVFRDHWKCLENNNQQMWQCRRPERVLNKCVFDNLALEKVIPDTPKGVQPVHLRQNQIYSTLPQWDRPKEESKASRAQRIQEAKEQWAAEHATSKDGAKS